MFFLLNRWKIAEFVQFKASFGLVGDVFTDSTMVNHHFSPPFGNYFLFFPTTFSKFKKKIMESHIFSFMILFGMWSFPLPGAFFFVRIFSESHQGSRWFGGLMNPMGLSFMGAFSPNSRGAQNPLYTRIPFVVYLPTFTIKNQPNVGKYTIQIEQPFHKFLCNVVPKMDHAYIFGNIFSLHKGSWIFK